MGRRAADAETETDVVTQTRHLIVIHSAPVQERPRVDWYLVACWTGMLVFCAGCWAVLGLLAWWLA